MSKPRTGESASESRRLWQRVSECLQQHVRLRRSGLGWRLALEPANAWRATLPMPRSVRRPPLPPMPGAHASAARHELRILLDHVPGARRVWPSLALLERVLGSECTDNIHRVEAAVLRHAARALDQLGDELFGPGLVVLRRRVELVLRRKHGDRPSHWARMPPPVGADQAARFSDSLTDYIDMDRMPLVAAAATASAPGATPRAARPRRG
ncbi:MAG: hypothetical protein JF586_10970 [Burkholderiales bacterium]|nr:hypothetical protein [Burkholderiales bacterium]